MQIMIQQVLSRAYDSAFLISSQMRPVLLTSGPHWSSVDLNHALQPFIDVTGSLCPKLQTSHYIYGESEAKGGKYSLRSHSQLWFETRNKSTDGG